VLKVISLIKRRDDLPLDEFRAWALERHAPKGRSLPGLREYRMSVVEQDDPGRVALADPVRRGAPVGPQGARDGLVVLVGLHVRHLTTVADLGPDMSWPLRRRRAGDSRETPTQSARAGVAWKVACETGEGAERLRGQKVEIAGWRPPLPDPDNAGEGKSPRRSFHALTETLTPGRAPPAAPAPAPPPR
jgi:hypothetical protein